MKLKCVEGQAEPGRQCRPPPPHDPTDRVLVGHLREWALRVFDPNGRRHEFFAPRGFLHVQLWHSETGVSVLSPSRITAFCYEAYPFVGGRIRVPSWSALSRAVYRTHGVRCPNEDEIQVVEQGWVKAASI